MIVFNRWFESALHTFAFYKAQRDRDQDVDDKPSSSLLLAMRDMESEDGPV